MPARIGYAFVVALAAFIAGCGGKEEVKKNEGKIENVMPSTAGGPSASNGGDSTSGGPAANSATAPTVPKPPE